MIFALLTLMFTACVPSNVADAISKMEKAGYTVSEPVIASSEQNAGAIGKIKAYKLDERYTPKDTIIILLFESEEKAKYFYESGGGWYDSVLSKSGYDGKWAYAASSEQAIKDFKK